MPETKSIAIGDILSVMTGRLVSHDGVSGIYNVLDWMTDQSLFTHQLPRASDVCEPVLKELFPQLAAIKFPVKRYEALIEDKATGDEIQAWIFEWVDKQGAKYGEWFDVPKLSEGQYERMGVFEELASKMSPDAEILAVVINDDKA